MYELYDYHTSGNGYKVALMLHHLDRPYRYHERDILAGETHTAEFLKLNPNGKIPVLITPEGHVLSESNAILYFLADGTGYFAGNALERQEIMRWLFWEQYSHEPYIATSRFWLHCPEPERFREKLAEKRPGGLSALAQMENHLATRRYFVGERYSIADIALYAYTHKAHEGGFPLDAFPAIRDWLDRVAAQPGHLRLEDKACVGHK